MRAGDSEPVETEVAEPRVGLRFRVVGQKAASAVGIRIDRHASRDRETRAGERVATFPAASDQQQ